MNLSLSPHSYGLNYMDVWVLRLWLATSMGERQLGVTNPSHKNILNMEITAATPYSSMEFTICDTILFTGVYEAWELWSHAPLWSLHGLRAVVSYSIMEFMGLDSCGHHTLQWRPQGLRAVATILCSGIYQVWDLCLHTLQCSSQDLSAVATYSLVESMGHKWVCLISAYSQLLLNNVNNTLCKYNLTRITLSLKHITFSIFWNGILIYLKKIVLYSNGH